jgi:superoxide dismutase, Fe-Mn family
MTETNSFTRRDFLATGSLAVAGGVFGVGGLTVGARGEAVVPEAGAIFSVPLQLPGLPYAYDALEPEIDAMTMEIHHSRHHAAYANNLASALIRYPRYEAHALEELLADIPALPTDIQVSVRNNGGGHWNHSLFWEIMTPDGAGQPHGAVAAAIDEEFGDFASMQEQFGRAAATRFGSGWAWLLVDAQGRLQISSTPNQDNPLMHGLVDVTGIPVLGLDVWEHAYYLLYQNRRADYVRAWWELVNWEKVDQLYRRALA